jgi:S-adenosylmethionine-diacylglycerol 3-amino-3-carboxypropyl transferase
MRLSGERSMSSGVGERADFTGIRYANCWEDAQILGEALAPLDGARCLSVASAGDNSFSLLARGASLVVAADISPAQLHLVELKSAGFRHLSHEELVGFLGVIPSQDRLITYKALRPALSADASAYWDRRGEILRAGVIHCGKFERYFGLFRRWVLPLIHPRPVVRSLEDPRDEGGREAFYEEIWNNRRWRLLFRIFFGKWVMGRLGRDPEFFRYVEGSVSQRILLRARHALTCIPTHDNPYLHYILNGNWEDRLPDYLLPELHEAIRARLDNLRLVLAPVEEAARAEPPRSFDAFNLSDIFEYMDPETYRSRLEALVGAAAPGARLAYWNMLAPRSRPESMADRLEPSDAVARSLLSRDRAFFYQRFVLEVAP